MLIQYVRDSNHNPFGVVVSTGRGKIGLALCHPKDRWNRDLGIKIAEGRANTVGCMVNIPKESFGLVSDMIVNMIHRSNRYFK